MYSTMYSNLRRELAIDNLLLMYVGNLETYQGIDLLLDSFALTLEQTDQAELVIIGGEADDIRKYTNKSHCLGMQQHVHFLGPKPVDDLAIYLEQADILVSPRTKGKNTPMKLYSYLDSGKVLLATDLPTHTQLLDNHVALLRSPDAKAFAEGMVALIADEKLRLRLGSAGKKLIEKRHTYAAFRQKLNSLYDWLHHELVEHIA
ncbi:MULTISPECIES: glycosyltransferase family 4 protein [unclassified Moorena]|uniref:glycosyltransferase family 4 protein n=1 Tax=unclassified Moorena TaxID=2683338 RepID=UPI0025F923CB|nr:MULTISPECIES: glycosyltransferase family 4 protein [unclassified Moorena]